MGVVSVGKKQSCLYVLRPDQFNTFIGSERPGRQFKMPGAFCVCKLQKSHSSYMLVSPKSPRTEAGHNKADQTSFDYCTILRMGKTT